MASSGVSGISDGQAAAFLDPFSYLDMIDAEIDRMMGGDEPALTAFPASTPSLSPAVESLPYSGSAFVGVQSEARPTSGARVPPSCPSVPEVTAAPRSSDLLLSAPASPSAVTRPPIAQVVPDVPTQGALQAQQRFVLFPENRLKRPQPGALGLEWFTSEPAALLPTVKIRRLVSSQSEADAAARKPPKVPKSGPTKAPSKLVKKASTEPSAAPDVAPRRRKTVEMAVDLALAVTKDDATACLAMLHDQCHVPTDPSLLSAQESLTWRKFQDMHAFWRALHGVLGQSPHTVIKKYPYVALRPLNFYDMFLAVQSFGGYFAITAANNRCPLGTFVASLPTRIPLDICDLQTKHSVVSDETGRQVEWSLGWEKVYAKLGLDAKDSVPYRRLRVKSAYEQYLLKLELVVSRFHPPISTRAASVSKKGEEVLSFLALKQENANVFAANTVPFVRCVCGHSHEWPSPWENSCASCRQVAMVECTICGCLQHRPCCYEEGWRGLKLHVAVNAIDHKSTVPVPAAENDDYMHFSATNADGFAGFACEMCAPMLWVPKFGREPMHQCHPKLLQVELPWSWTCQRRFRRGTNGSDFYVFRHEDVYHGTQHFRTMRSVPHLQEALVGEESDARKHGKTKTVSDTGETVFVTPADKTVWKPLSQTLQSAVASWRRRQVGSLANYHIGQLVDSRTDSGTVPVIICGNVSQEVLAVMSFEDRATVFDTAVAAVKKHKGFFVVSSDISGGSAARPVRCVNDVDAACVIEDSLTWEKTCVPGPGVKGDLAKVSKDDVVTCGCTTGRGCVAGDPVQCACMTAPIPFAASDGSVLRECSAAACGCAPKCKRAFRPDADVEVFRSPTGEWAVRSCDTPIAAGVYIGEFVGELVTDDIAVKRAVLMNPSHSSSHLFALSHFAALPDSGRPYLSDGTSCPSPPTGPLFVIDAGRIANVSRFIRHSCEPTLVPRVIIDDHRSKFVYKVGLFTARAVAPHTELTLDFHYQRGSLPGLVLLCKCGSPSCRGRLL